VHVTTECNALINDKSLSDYCLRHQIKQRSMLHRIKWKEKRYARHGRICNGMSLSYVDNEKLRSDIISSCSNFRCHKHVKIIFIFTCENRNRISGISVFRVRITMEI